MTGFVLCCLSLLFFTSLLAFDSYFCFFVHLVAKLGLVIKNSFFSSIAFSIDLFTSLASQSTILHGKFFEGTLRDDP